MSEVIDLGTKKNKIFKLLGEATPADQEPNNHFTLSTLLALSLIGTMFPVQAAVTFFSLATISAFLIFTALAWKKQARLSKPASAILVGLALTSALSGCGPALFGQTSPDFFELIRDREYKSYVMSGTGVFGLGLDDITIENAQFEGNIETVHVAEVVRGYGIISMARVTVAGE